MALILPKKNKARGVQTAVGPKGPVTGPAGPLALGAPLTPQPKQPQVQTQASNAANIQGPAPVDPKQDPDYIARHALLAGTLRDTNTSLDQEEGRAKQEFGFDDASNPFSRQALLRQQISNQQRGTTNAMAARGQLYAGSYATAQTRDTRNGDIATDSLRRSYDDVLRNIGDRRKGAQTAYDSGDITALEGARDRALANPPAAAELPQQDLSSNPQMTGIPQTAAQKRRAARLAQGISLKGGISAAEAKKLRDQGLL